MLVSLGLRPSLHAAARQMPTLPVSVTALYDKVNHTEPGVMRALVRGSGERLTPVVAAVGHGACLPGWEVRVLDVRGPRVLEACPAAGARPGRSAVDSLPGGA